MSHSSLRKQRTFVCAWICDASFVLCDIAPNSPSVPTALNNVEFVPLQWTHILSKGLALNIYGFNKSLDVLSFKA